MMLEQVVQSGEFGVEAAADTPFEDIHAVMAVHEGRVFRFLLMQLRDRDVALSLTQDTFLNAWRSRASFRGDCSVATWLTRIAVSLLRSHVRTESFKFWKRAAQSSVDATELAGQLRQQASSSEERLVAREQLAQVWDDVDRLSERQRMVFLLRFVEEMELPEIAAATGMNLATVKSHLYRGLDAVRSGKAMERKGKR